MDMMDFDNLIERSAFCINGSLRVLEESRRILGAWPTLAGLTYPVPAGRLLPTYEGDAALRAEVDRVLSRAANPMQG